MSIFKSTLHLCNTFFEWELQQEQIPDLETAFAQNSLFLQLQFLPLLYAPKLEPILVTEIPKDFDHSFTLIKTPPKKGTIHSWGYSRAIFEWAKKHHLSYSMPPWEAVIKVNSKAFSFARSPLPGAKLIYNETEAKHFLQKNFVWKSCFGAAGKGHFFPNNAKLSSFLEEEWKKGLPVIVEPWVERICDFSTHWEITQGGDIRFLGVTFLHNTVWGIYRGNTAGNLEEESIFAEQIYAQQKFCEPILKEIAKEGYFGEVGIDAMIYHEENQKKLQPIVEINARKTMGWVCLILQKHIAPQKALTLEYINAVDPSNSILPSYLEKTSGQKIHFSKQVKYTIH